MKHSHCSLFTTDTIEPKPEQQLHARQTSSKAQRKFSSGRVGAQWIHSGSGEHGKLGVKRNSSGKKYWKGSACFRTKSQNRILGWNL